MDTVSSASWHDESSECRHLGDAVITQEIVGQEKIKEKMDLKCTYFLQELKESILKVEVNIESVKFLSSPL